MIFRATEQWFIGMDRNDFRQHALEAIQQVRWMPEWGEERISNMIATRPDWCISRQRVWGVPIIVFYCDALPRAAHRSQDPGRHRATVPRAHRRHLVRAHGRRAAAARHRLRQVRRRRSSARKPTFWTSGSIPARAIWPCSTERFGLPWPADLYIEGGDQYRGWFHSSLLVGTGLKGGAPYRACALNGWVLDGEGRAMHKSLGNAIEPEEIIKHHGAEILRLWSASVEFSEDVRLSETILTRLVEAYRKLRNTFRYLLGNLYGFRSRRPMPCRRPRCRRSTSGFCCAPKTWWPAAAPGTTTSSFTRSTTRSTPSPRWI